MIQHGYYNLTQRKGPATKITQHKADETFLSIPLKNGKRVKTFNAMLSLYFRKRMPNDKAVMNVF